MLPLRDNVPTRSFPIVTIALIVVNMLVWVLYQLPDLLGSVNELAYHPCEVENSCPTVGHDWQLTALTAMFLHASWLHLLGNMLFLWIFGNNVEDALGGLRYLLFYLARRVRGDGRPDVRHALAMRPTRTPRSRMWARAAPSPPCSAAIWCCCRTRRC